MLSPASAAPSRKRAHGSASASAPARGSSSGAAAAASKVDAAIAELKAFVDEAVDFAEAPLERALRISMLAEEEDEGEAKRSRVEEVVDVDEDSDDEKSETSDEIAARVVREVAAAKAKEKEEAARAEAKAKEEAEEDSDSDESEVDEDTKVDRIIKARLAQALKEWSPKDGKLSTWIDEFFQAPDVYMDEIRTSLVAVVSMHKHALKGKGKMPSYVPALINTLDKAAALMQKLMNDADHNEDDIKWVQKHLTEGEREKYDVEDEE